MTRKFIALLSLILAVVMLLTVSGCAPKQAETGDTVRVHYTGRLQNGEVFDASAGDEPLEFTLGQGQMITGAQLSKYMKRTSKTLRRWDKAGMVPTGKKWLPGTKVSGNVIVYELASNWPAIQSMISRERNTCTDRQIAQELGALAVDGHDSVSEKSE